MSLKQPLLENEQLFFVHVPKCAGTTFINVLDQHFTNAEILPVHYDLKQLQEEFSDRQLAGYRFLRGHFPYDTLIPRLPGLPRLITFLRNPVTQFISIFEMRQRVPDPLVGLRETLSGLTLEQFLDQPELANRFANQATRLIGGDVLENGQPRPNLERAKERLAAFDFVGLTEQFDESLELFSYIFNFEPINTYETLNVSPGREKRSATPQNLLDRVAETQKYDLELYQFGQALYQTLRAQMLAEKAAGSPQVALGVPVAEVHLDFRRVNPGMGWHVGEAHPTYGCTRWSGPETTSRLQFHLQSGRDYTIRFRVLKALETDVLRSLRLEINDQPIPLKSHRDEQRAVIFEGVIPDAAIRPGAVTILALKIDRTLPVNHKDLKTKALALLGQPVIVHEADTRRVGLRYHWLEILPR